MFRLTQNRTSYNNHRIIHQTTKISYDESKITIPTSQRDKNPPEVSPQNVVPQPNPFQPVITPRIETHVTSMENISIYIERMRVYQQHMKNLETRNAMLEKENSIFKLENDLLKSQMEITATYQAASSGHMNPNAASISKSSLHRSNSLPPSISTKIQNELKFRDSQQLAQRPH